MKAMVVLWFQQQYREVLKKENAYASASTLCLPTHNPYCSGQNSPERYLI